MPRKVSGNHGLGAKNGFVSRALCRASGGRRGWVASRRYGTHERRGEDGWGDEERTGDGTNLWIIPGALFFGLEILARWLSLAVQSRDAVVEVSFLEGEDRDSYTSSSRKKLAGQLCCSWDPDPSRIVVMVGVWVERKECGWTAARPVGDCRTTKMGGKEPRDLGGDFFSKMSL